MRPFAGDRWWPLALAAASLATCAVIAGLLAARRDFGQGLLPQRLGHARAPRTLRSPLGLAWRLQRGILIGWAVAMLGFGLVMGSMIDQVRASTGSGRDWYTQVGGSAQILDAYRASVLQMAAMGAAIYVVQVLLRMAGEEADGTVEAVLATAASRTRWALAHAVNATVGVAILLGLFAAGVALAAGAVLGDPVHEVAVLVPGTAAQLPAVLAVGAAVLALVATQRRRAVGPAWALLIACILAGPMFGTTLSLPPWVQDLSPFSYAPKAPAVSITAMPVLTTLLVAAALMAVALVWLRRRDLGPPRLSRSGRGDHEDEVAALYLLVVALMASRSTVPQTAAVMLASIFIASMVATTAPASTVSPSSTVRVTTPANGAATWPCLAGSAFSADLTSAVTERSRTWHGPELAVDRAHHGAQPCRSASPIACRPSSSRLPGSMSTSCSGPDRGRGGTRGCRAPTGRRSASRLSSKSLVGPGKSSRFRVRRGVGASASSCSAESSVSRGLAVPALQGLGPERLGPATGRVAEVAVEEADDRVGDVVAVGFASKSSGSALAPTRARARSPTTLERGRHLDDVAQDAVGRGVHVLDGLEPVAEAESDRLLAQVGQLPAGDLVAVDASGGRGRPDSNGAYSSAHRLPVGLERGGRVESRPGGPLGAVGGGDQRRHRHGWLVVPGHRGAGDVDGIHAGVDGGQQGGELATGGVVGVQVHRQVEALAQRGDELGRRRGPQQPRHVLDGQDVRAGVDELLGEAKVVVEGVELSRRGWSGCRCSRARPRRRQCRCRARPRSPGASGRRH